MASSEETVRLVPRAGEAGRLRLTVLGPNFSSTHVLVDGGEVRIGRGEGVDVRIDDPAISRLHAVVRTSDQVTLEDLGSANGTRLRGETIAPHVRLPLLPGDVVEIGSSVLLLQDESGPRPAASAQLDAQGEREDEEVTARTAPPATSSAPVRAMARVHHLVERVAPSSINVLLLGENGVGKDVIANELHRRSQRASGPFVPINCASVVESLLEAELFGHEKVFTGAEKPKPGLLEAAHGGTVLLDEIGEMPLAMQSKLLRVLETREVWRVGALQGRRVDIRIIAATNRDLEAEVEKGTFRRDLFFRLNGISIRIPPLRDRREEIPELARTFVKEMSARDQLGAKRLSERALKALGAYSWPGNVRELRNAIHQALILCAGATIEEEDLPDEVRRSAHAGNASVPAPPSPVAAPTAAAEPADRTLRAEVKTAERKRIVEALEACAWNQTRAARALGVSRRTLVSRMKDYDIPGPRARARKAD